MLSLLMCGLESRPWQLVRDAICAQCEPVSSHVEFLTEIDDGTETSGVKRQRLMDSATGRYVAFLDDDDEYDPNYVRSLLRGCASAADVVTFCLDMLKDGRGIEKWQFGLHPNNRRSGLMCANHLCAWRSDIARQVAWCPELGYADDHLWFQPLYHAGLLATQWHVQRVLYHYIYTSRGTANQTAERIRKSREYVGTGLRCFRTQADQLLVEVGGQRNRGSLKTLVRNCRNEVSEIDVREHQHYHTITIG